MAITQGTAMWAFVQKPTQNFNRDGYEYAIDLQVSPEEAKKLKAQGLNVRDKDGIPTIKFKLPAERKDGTKNEAPAVVGADNMPFSGPGIGNGSKVRVKYRIYEWEFGRKKGTGCALQAVQVIDLVPYEGGDSEDFEAASGDSPF